MDGFEVAIHRQDCENETSICVTDGNTILGRGGTLQIDDKKVSRNHALLCLKCGKLTIKSTHVNPCFVILKESGKKLLLKHGASVDLSNGDEFSLLQNKYKYKVIWENNNSIDKDKGKEIQEDPALQSKIENINSNDLSTSNFQKLKKIFPSKRNASEDSENSVSKKRKLPSWMRKTSTTEEVDDQPPEADVDPIVNNHISIELSSDAKPNISVGNTEQSENENDLNEVLESDVDDEDLVTSDFPSDARVKISVENTSEPEIENNGSDSDHSISDAKRITVDPDYQTESDCDDNSSPVNQIQSTSQQSSRQACAYGRSCYRKNPNHLREFSHPNDADYESPPPSDEDRPECEYGTTCYRKNPLHRPNPNPRKQFKHTKRVVPRRQTKRRSNDDDDDDYDDSFINDSEEEEIIDEDSDWEPSGATKKKQREESEKEEDIVDSDEDEDF